MSQWQNQPPPIIIIPSLQHLQCYSIHKDNGYKMWLSLCTKKNNLFWSVTLIIKMIPHGLSNVIQSQWQNSECEHIHEAI